MPDLRPEVLKALKNHRSGQHNDIYLTPEQHAKLNRIKIKSGRPSRDIFYALYRQYLREPDNFPAIEKNAAMSIRTCPRLARGVTNHAKDIAWRRGQSKAVFLAGLLHVVSEADLVTLLISQTDRVEMIEEVIGGKRS